ncbi:MAG: molecular chaperone HtpG [Oscillospiraceae bacterium]|nr:molecular chaperone HtpG [Oscillospiraceae bacterium]
MFQMAESKQFKAESKRLLDMMINSIYTHKEIFLRELISNASDAIDKLYFKSLTDDGVGMKKDDFQIFIEADKDNGVLKITDNGIGMTADELENNLGTIANSGSLAFKNENGNAEDIDIIGQFGVGFYSAFMVAKDVEVRSKAYGSDKAYLWKSSGVEGYTIEECEKSGVGTEITLTLKDDTDDESYSDYLMQWKLKSLVKKYSDYIRFPIKMETEHDHLKEGTGTEDVPAEYETHTEIETLNSMVPLWRKNKSEITDEEYNKFYREKFYDYNEPLVHIHAKAEGTATYDALLYIPSQAPMDYYTKEFEKGLQLFSSGVLIMDKCGDLLPDHFSFVKGLADSQDLSLNISREMLQHDRQLKLIAKSLERTVKNELKKLLTNEREKYEKFWKAFGLQIKFGIYNSYGANKELLKDLLMFSSSFEKKFVTLDEYVSRMKEDQKYIYYAAGESVAKIDCLPQTEVVKDKGYEILYLTESVDEFAIQMLMSYEDKQFKSVSASDLDIETPEEKEETKKLAEDSRDMFACLKEALGDKVKEVRLSERLKTHPCCLTNEGQISLDMEKTFAAMPSNEHTVKAEKVLEINPNHQIFKTLQSLCETDKDKLAAYGKILYAQALLIEGMPVEDPLALSELLCDLMTDKQ